MYGGGEVDEECGNDDTLADVLERERRYWVAAKKSFFESGRAALDRQLEALRKDSVQLPGDDTAWMTEEERRCVEWFDRRDYDTFMKRSAWYEGDGWIVPYCRMMCEERGLVSCAVLSDYANDYDSPGDFELEGLCKRTVREGASRRERFLRIADKIFEAAKSGNARAQNAVGIFCEHGNPVCDKTLLLRNLGLARCNSVAAREWYRRSAEGGCLQGIRNYARALFNGIGMVREEHASADRWLIAERDRKTALDLYRALASRGDGKAQYRLACVFAENVRVERDVSESAGWLRKAAQSGHRQAATALAAAGDDTSDERLFAELLILWQKERLGELRNEPDYTVAWDIKAKPEFSGGSGSEPVSATGDEWLLKDKPEGTVLPPSAGRDRIRVPNLTSANPSFAARLIILVRDRFGGDAPAVYKAAHVSRKTYSSIVSNELRPIAKGTAVAFALAMRLSPKEASDLLESAGFSFSQFYLEDIIVKTCITAGIYDIERVNAILAAHGAKTFRAE